MHKTVIFVLALCLCMTSIQPAAAQFDGSEPLLCAVVQVVECEANGQSHPVTIEMAGMPRFLNIDFEKKIISANEESNITDVSEIRNYERSEGRLIIQGAENGRGWTMVMSEETGKMSATVSDEKVGFVVFGACTRTDSQQR